jgi:hypothetical protein
VFSRRRRPHPVTLRSDLRARRLPNRQLDLGPMSALVESCRSDRPVSMSALAVCSPKAAGPLPATPSHQPNGRFFTKSGPTGLDGEPSAELEPWHLPPRSRCSWVLLQSRHDVGDPGPRVSQSSADCLDSILWTEQRPGLQSSQTTAPLWGPPHHRRSPIREARGGRTCDKSRACGRSRTAPRRPPPGPSPFARSTVDAPLTPPTHAELPRKVPGA